jgi:hypothetical protein
MSTNSPWSLWMYVPTEDCTHWDPPLLLWHTATQGQAHDQARLLREHWPGHLIAVTPFDRTPKSTLRPDYVTAS